MLIKPINMTLDSFLGRSKYYQTCVLLFVFLVVSLTKSHFSYHLISFPLIAVSIGSLLVKFDLTKNKVFWVSILLLLLLSVLQDWTMPANHDYLLIYFISIVLLSSSSDASISDARLETHSLILFVLTFCLAGLQKLLSPQFIDGSYLSYAYHSGHFTPFLLNKIAFFNESFQNNQEILKELMQSDPNLGKVSTLGYRITGSEPFFKYLSWTVVLIEFIIGVMAIFFRKSKVFLWLVLAFCTLVFLARPEGFVCVMLILVWPHLPEKKGKIHYAYLLVMILILAMIVLNKAFR